ncbi:hypothetical protein, partial [Hoeflea poritis]
NKPAASGQPPSSHAAYKANKQKQSTDKFQNMSFFLQSRTDPERGRATQPFSSFVKRSAGACSPGVKMTKYF